MMNGGGQVSGKTKSQNIRKARVLACHMLPRYVPRKSESDDFFDYIQLTVASRVQQQKAIQREREDFAKDEALQVLIEHSVASKRDIPTFKTLSQLRHHRIYVCITTIAELKFPCLTGLPHL